MKTNILKLQTILDDIEQQYNCIQKVNRIRDDKLGYVFDNKARITIETDAYFKIKELKLEFNKIINNLLNKELQLKNLISRNNKK